MTENWTWSPKWSQPLTQSSWGILERCKLANVTTDSTILEYFADPSKKAQRYEQIRWRESAVRDVFKTPFWYADAYFRNAFIHRLFDAPMEEATMFRSHVTWCPMCLAVGFHSLWHQYGLLTHCPFHAVALLDTCSACGERIPYKLTPGRLREAFTCSCGHPLTTVIRPWKDWPIELPFHASYKDLELFAHFMRTTNIDFSHVYASAESFVGAGIEGITTLLHAFEQVTTVKVSQHARSTRHFLSSRREREWERFYWIQSLENELYPTFRQIYASIMRHHRKTWMKSHRLCCRRIGRYGETNPCRFAYAYTEYRADRERAKITDIDQGRRPRKVDPFGLFSIQQNPLLLWITCLWFDVYEPDVEGGLPSDSELYQLITALFASSIHTEFVQWLDACVNTTEVRPIRNKGLEFWNHPSLQIVVLGDSEVNLTTRSVGATPQVMRDRTKQQWLAQDHRGKLSGAQEVAHREFTYSSTETMWFDTTREVATSRQFGVRFRNDPLFPPMIASQKSKKMAILQRSAFNPRFRENTEIAPVLSFVPDLTHSDKAPDSPAKEREAMHTPGRIISLPDHFS